MAAALTMSGAQQDPFYSLQKAALSAAFSLEDSALFALDCKISEADKAGHNDYTQVRNQERLNMLWVSLNGRGRWGAANPEFVSPLLAWKRSQAPLS